MNETLYFKKKKQELEALISQLELRLGSQIDGTLRISSAHGYHKYYLRRHNAPEGVPKEQYLGKKDLELARQLAQQDYEKQLLQKAKLLLRKAAEREEEFDDHSLQDIYDSLHEARKKLVIPLVISDEDYAKRWLGQKYEPGFFAEDSPRLFSENGERVRSKSEKIIADKYFRCDIPYLYERPFNLKDESRVITLRPDFTILNKRTRQLFYHEHFGMIDRPDYAAQCLKKLDLYAANGIFPGNNLLITMESSSHPLSEKYLDLIIETYLL